MNRNTIARIAHEINRAYCASLGDTSQVAWEDAPEWQQQSALAGVDMHLANPDATPEQSHESWLAAKLADGWAYGEVKDAENKLHPCCVPYAELPESQKAKDYLFRATVHLLKVIPDAVRVAAPVGETAIKAPLCGIAVQYIGHRPQWDDRVYNTGLTFETEQIRTLPAEIARNLLNHADLFQQVQSDVEQVEAPADAQVDDDTANQLEQGKQAQQEKQDVQVQVQDLFDQIDRMDKKGLAQFAKTNYRQELNLRDNVPTLRSQVKQMVDQFGVV